MIRAVVALILAVFLTCSLAGKRPPVAASAVSAVPLAVSGAATGATATKAMRASLNALAEPRFDPIGVDAIPRAVVATLAQDSAGLIWIASGDGLMRYDGYRFSTQERDSPVLANRSLGWIRALLPARDGRLWIGTETNGLAVYDPTTGRVTDQPADGARQAPGGASQAVPPKPTIRALAEDRDGVIWIGSFGGGLTRFDPSTGRFSGSHQHDQAAKLPDDRVLALLVDRQGALWVGHWQGLSRRAAGSERFETMSLPGLDGSQVQALFEASDGSVWAGTQQGAIARIGANGGQARILPSALVANNGQPGAVTAIAEAQHGQVWVGRSSGIDLHDLRDGTVLRTLRHDPRKPAGLAGNEISSLILDTSGAIWVGGFGLGLQRHMSKFTGLWLRGPDPSPDSPLGQSDLRSLLSVDNGEVWAAPPSGGVVIMDDVLRVTGALRPGSSVRSDAAAAVAIHAMAQASDGTVWLAADTALYQYTRDRRPLRSLAHGGGRPHRLLGAADGSLWMGSHDGLHRLSPGASQWQRVAQVDGQPLVGAVFAIVQSADTGLWVGTAAGLYRVEPGATALQAVRSAPGAGLGNPAVIGLLIDRSGILWLDTAVAGLHRLAKLDTGLARFDRISERHRIVGRPFGVNLLQDERGRIWTQMHVYDPASDYLHALTHADGANLGTGWFRSYTGLPDGRMLFGGSRGLLVVNPQAFDASTYAPPLVVSALRINGQQAHAGNLALGLKVAPGQRSLSLEFAALDYADPGRIRYAHRLVGFDPDWVQSGADFRLASYTQLDPGDYVLRARATNRSGMWSPNELAIPIQVLPAWWQRDEIRLAGLLLLALALLAAVQLHTRQLRASREALTKLVGERKAELESLTLAMREESAALHESSLTDPLTGLRNRRFLSEHIDADISLALRRHDSHLAYGAPLPADADLVFFLVDIDRFKQVNDRHGHAAGDAVISQMRSRLQAVFRDTDYLVRWGGEEFLVVARSTAREHAPELAERMRRSVAEHAFDIGKANPLRKTCSIGFACFPLAPKLPRALDWETTIRAADTALYAVKRAGRNGWLGLLSAEGETAEDLQSATQGTLVAWWRSGRLRLVSSPEHEQWAESHRDAAATTRKTPS